MFKKQNSQKLIESKVNNFFEIHKINSLTLKNKLLPQKWQGIHILKSSLTLQQFTFVTVHYDSKNVFESVFETHKIKPVYTSKKVSDYFGHKSKCSETFQASVINRHTFINRCRFEHLLHREILRQSFWRFADHSGTD